VHRNFLAPGKIKDNALAIDWSAGSLLGRRAKNTTRHRACSTVERETRISSLTGEVKALSFSESRKTRARFQIFGSFAIAGMDGVVKHRTVHLTVSVR
jgi:hypothetical protein